MKGYSHDHGHLILIWTSLSHQKGHEKRALRLISMKQLSDVVIIGYKRNNTQMETPSQDTGIRVPHRWSCCTHQNAETPRVFTCRIVVYFLALRINPSVFFPDTESGIVPTDSVRRSRVQSPKHG